MSPYDLGLYIVFTHSSLQFCLKFDDIIISPKLDCFSDKY